MEFDTVGRLERQKTQLEQELQQAKSALVHEYEVLHKASVSIDAAITRVFGRPWSVDAQRAYAECVSAAQNLMKAKDEELQAANLAHEQYREWAAGQMENLKARMETARAALHHCDIRHKKCSCSREAIAVIDGVVPPEEGPEAL